MTDLPADPTERARIIARNLIDMLPHATALGLHLEEVDEGAASISMPWRADLVGDPQTGVIHGGAVSALMDTCCGAAVLGHPQVPGPVATIDLRIDYMRAAKPGQRIIARAECYHLTRSVAFVRAHAYDEDGTRPVATATGTFTTGAA
ncbi:MAG: PaaI family thioesterase [Paracoccus sp. (in: a-proteobacteria)]|uniref:PaaI family thioesterase n=1 Tax=Paracoccus sp. TaxID=267 RepID=UPI0026E007DD|nr:PaaI family thioesterase [Paracoccus sp. (in: a-proteobacteria)]MDO5621080.1 PaaI family thioesterase [Paracoccus sp. (in: a-proteobacteria)]